MRLLIVTQAVDSEDPVLGFFHDWIAAFASHADSVLVICLREGKHALPGNVEVRSLGKEHGRKSRAEYAFRFLSFIWNKRHSYDAVFVHMNPEYVLLGGMLWRILKKPVGLWYLHKKVTPTLYLAAQLATVVFTASTESFRMKTKKLEIVGHGIDTTQFGVSTARRSGGARFVTVGRIALAKNVAHLIDVIELLHAQGISATLDIIGAPVTDADKAYQAALEHRIQKGTLGNSVHLLGARQHTELPILLPAYDLFLHASTGTGSLDKAVLESLLAGVPVISSSIAFRTLLEPYGLFVPTRDAKHYAKQVAEYLAKPDATTIAAKLAAQVREQHALANLIPRILKKLATAGRT